LEKIRYSDSSRRPEFKKVPLDREVFRYICDNYSADIGPELCAVAASSGQLEFLSYAHDRGCPWDEHTPANAAKHGHLHCLMYARENNCPWDKDTCAEAAREGHLNCLKYAYKYGCAILQTVIDIIEGKGLQKGRGG
jgi:hypothetical protein